MEEVRKPPVGSRPGTLAIDPDALEPLVKLVVYSKDSLRESDVDDVESLRELIEGDAKFWVDVQGLGDEHLLRTLAELFSIHPLALEDIAHVGVRPKSEPYDDQLLIVTRMLRHNQDARSGTAQVTILLGRNYVLTFQEHYGDVLEPVRHRLRVPRSMMRSCGPDYLAYALLDTIVDAYYPVIEKLGDEIEGLEEAVLQTASEESLRELNRIKSLLLSLRRAVLPQRDAVNAMIRGDSDLISDTVRTYLRDTYDHIVQTSDAVEAARELVGGLMNTYLSVVSNRMNEVMKTLTIVASVFVPLTFMAGIYGMNFERMPELHARWGYPILLAAMGFVALLMVVYFWRKGWIASQRRDRKTS